MVLISREGNQGMTHYDQNRTPLYWKILEKSKKNPRKILNPPKKNLAESGSSSWHEHAKVGNIDEAIEILGYFENNPDADVNKTIARVFNL